MRKGEVVGDRGGTREESTARGVCVVVWSGRRGVAGVVLASVLCTQTDTAVLVDDGEEAGQVVVGKALVGSSSDEGGGGRPAFDSARGRWTGGGEERANGWRRESTTEMEPGGDG